MIEKNYNQPSSLKFWKAGFYIRLSREDVENDKALGTMKTYNKTESESITSQRVILTEYANKLENVEVVDEYVDDGYSGTNFNRPGFKRLIDDVRSGKINCVIVKDLSRFGRNYSEVGNYLEVFFPMLNVRFISIIDNCDSYLKPESLSNIIVPVKNIMNESYCRDISLKVRSAFDARKRQGLFVGTYATYGYIKDPQNCNKLLVDLEASEIVKRIFSDFASGKTMGKIAFALNEEGVLCPATYKSSKGINKYVNSYGDKIGWKDSSIRRILTNPIYIGTLVQKHREKINYKVHKFKQVAQEDKIVVENVTEPIIEKALFDKVQDLLKRDTRVSFGKQQLDLLSGFLHCATCRHGMSKKKSRKGHSKTEYIEYYNCSNFKRCGKAICSPHSIRKADLENTVFEYIKTYIQVAVNFENIIDLITKFKLENYKSDNLEQILKIKLNDKQKKIRYIDGLYPDYKNEIITQAEYKRYKEQAQNELVKLEEEINSLEEQITSFKNGTQVDNPFVSHFVKFRDIESLDRSIVTELIDNIWIHENNLIEIDIKYKDEYKIAIEFIENNKHILELATTSQRLVANG